MKSFDRTVDTSDNPLVICIGFIEDMDSAVLKPPMDARDLSISNIKNDIVTPIN